MSKLIYHTFRCEDTDCDSKFEELVSTSVIGTICAACGSSAHRIISAPGFNLGNGIDPDYPTTYDKWEKQQKEKQVNEKRHYAEHGIDLTYGGDTTR